MHTPKKRILILDDDFKSMEPLKQYLVEEAEYEVELTASKSILEQLKTERFDLLIIDLMIHQMSLGADGNEVENVQFKGVNWDLTGGRFYQELRAGSFAGKEGEGTPPDVPVVMLSAVGLPDDEDDMSKLKDFPEDRHFEKPFRLEQLVKRICELLES